MILFKDDWVKYPGIMVDVQTPNRSWVRMAGVLKAMGVDNHQFILALHDRELQGVDPHDPDISEEQKLRIITEVAINPWYFFRECVRVPAKGSPEPVMLGCFLCLSVYPC